MGDAYAKSLDDHVARHKRLAAASRADLIDRVDELEADLARVCLLLKALTDLCIARGVCTAEQLAAAIDATDLLDGVADGKLDPSVMRPEGETKPEVSPEEYFKQLEDREKKTKPRKPKQ
jgi:hypothetical protein